MRSRGLRRAARALAVAGAAALLTTVSPVSAQAATEYDGEATALRIEGLRLELFPHGTDNVPEQLQPLVDALKKLQSQAPDEFQRGSLALAVPDQVIAHAEYPNNGTEGELPPNPLIAAEVLEARSARTDNGNVVSEASIAGLSLGGGVLSADVIKSQCVGTGENITLDVSLLELDSTEEIVRTEVDLPPGEQVRIEGLGTITFNQQDSDGTTYGEATNVVVDLNTDLSLDAVARIFDTTAPATERVLGDAIRDVSETTFPDGEQHLAPLGENVNQFDGTPLYDGIDQGLDELSENTPAPVKDALNNVAHLEGTITVANAACAQDTFSNQSAPSEPQQQPVQAQPVSNDNEPPLADTGSPAGMVAMGLAGVAALALGGLVLARLRRSGM